MVHQKVEICPCCLGDHPELKFKMLARPTQHYNCWAQCPTTKEPIMGFMGLRILASVPPETIQSPGDNSNPGDK